MTSAQRSNMEPLSPTVFPKVIVPPGWTWISLVDESHRTEFDDLFEKVLERGPRDSLGPFVRKFRESLNDLVERSRSVGGLALIMPIGTPWMSPVSGSIFFAEVPAFALQADDAEVQVVDTLAGQAQKRLDTVTPPPMSSTDELRLVRSLEYRWMLDGESQHVLVATSTIMTSGEDDMTTAIDGLADLLDAILESTQIIPLGGGSKEGADSDSFATLR